MTTEANPESTDPELLRALRGGGFTRVSLGMQSAAPHVLRTLDRVHTPGRATAAAIEAREAGFEHVSLDLIYGTPGETDADWERTLEAAFSARARPHLYLRADGGAGDRHEPRRQQRNTRRARRC